MRATGLGIVFVVLCGIGAAPLLVRTEPLSAAHAGFSATAVASMPLGRNITAPRTGAADASGCKAEYTYGGGALSAAIVSRLQTVAEDGYVDVGGAVLECVGRNPP